MEALHLFSFPSCWGIDPCITLKEAETINMEHSSLSSSDTSFYTGDRWERQGRDVYISVSSLGSGDVATQEIWLFLASDNSNDSPQLDTTSSQQELTPGD